jgi:hypothetical protein
MSESADKARLVAALMTAKLAIESVLMQVMDEAPPAPEAPPETLTAAVAHGECQHPQKMRMEIKSMGSHEHWLCDPMKGGCGYEYRR